MKRIMESFVGSFMFVFWLLILLCFSTSNRYIVMFCSEPWLTDQYAEKESNDLLLQKPWGRCLIPQIFSYITHLQTRCSFRICLKQKHGCNKGWKKKTLTTNFFFNVISVFYSFRHDIWLKTIINYIRKKFNAVIVT